MPHTAGIHHITAVVADARQTVQFYRDVLGQTLVKKTVNFDDPTTYHLYFGDAQGAPGTIMTFFPFAGARQGRIGSGQVGEIRFATGKNALSTWKERLAQYAIPFTETTIVHEAALQLSDPSGLKLAIVAHLDDETTALTKFHSVLLLSKAPATTAKLLETVFEATEVETDEVVRYKAGEQWLDIETNVPHFGLSGTGTVHHIALRAADDEQQKQFWHALHHHSYAVTQVLDRNYFRSIYFREKGEILFEIATDPPGFAVDEERLGEKLMLPTWLEPHRADIEAALPNIEEDGQ